MPLNGPFALLNQRRFLPLFCTQFFGAFNDSVFRNSLIILLTFSAKSTLFNQATVINFAAALFVIPYFLFSAFAGQLADKVEKSLLIRMIKWAEVFLAALAVLGFYLDNLTLLLMALFLLGTQATFFGPLKYSILPQHLAESELIAGNGLIEMGTFIAILFGTILGGILIAIPETGYLWVSIALGTMAFLGLASSLFIPVAPAFVPHLKLDWNLWRETVKIVKASADDRTIFYSIIGISWFWLYGSMFLTQIANFTKLVLNGTEHVATLLLTTFSIGIGVGSVLCAKLSDKKIEMGLVPLGAIGLTIFAIDFALAPSPFPSQALDTLPFFRYGHNWRILMDAFLMGMFGGFYLVPLYALIQKESVPGERSRMIAANNIFNALFMTAASIIAIVVLNAGFSVPQLFLLTAILNAVVALFIFNRVPEFLMRFFVWTLIHTVYRVTEEDLRSIPAEGPAILAYNPTNFFDALLIMAVCRRPIRFLTAPTQYRSRILQFIFKTSHAIDITSKDALVKVDLALSQGALIGFFLRNPLNEGIKRIVERDHIPMIPILLEGQGRHFLQYRIRIIAGELRYNNVP